MRPWTLPIVGAVALSLAIPSAAQARLRFGPGAVLGAFAGAMFGGFHYAGRHHHRRAVMHASAGPRNGAHFQRRAAARRSVAVAPQPPANPPQAPQDTSAQRAPERTAATFWPDAAADLADYVLLPSGNSRFWTHGYDSIVEAAFAGSDAADQGGARARAAAPRLSDAGAPNTPVASADLCGATSASADQSIEKIHRGVEPSAGVADWMMRAIERAAPGEQQRGGVEAMRMQSAAMARLVAASCPSDPRPDAMGRVAAATDRLDVMLFAVMSVSPMLQQFYDSLDDRQKARLARALRQARR